MKLLNAIEPDVLYLGQKDAQQVAVLRTVMKDLDMACEVVVGETIREPDGLALASRNAYLSWDERRAAPRLYRALRAIATAIKLGETDRERALALGRSVFTEPLREAYLDVVDWATFEPLDRLAPPCLVIGSAWLGNIRVIDNVPVGES